MLLLKRQLAADRSKEFHGRPGKRSDHPWTVGRRLARPADHGVILLIVGLILNVVPMGGRRRRYY
jgi:hypothetical protein